MHSIRTCISFEAAHRLYDVVTYSRECSDNLHGHSYKVFVNCSCNDLNSAGMVIDFKLLKKILKTAIEDKYDHSCIIRDCDPLKKALLTNCKKVVVVEESPTAEWMAKEFAFDIQTELNKYAISENVIVNRVEVQETENNTAIWEADDAT